MPGPSRHGRRSTPYRPESNRTVNDRAPSRGGRTVNTPHRNDNRLINAISRSPVGNMLINDAMQAALGGMVSNSSEPDGMDPARWTDNRFPGEHKGYFGDYSVFDILAGGHPNDLARREGHENWLEYRNPDRYVQQDLEDDLKTEERNQVHMKEKALYGALFENLFGKSPNYPLTDPSTQIGRDIYPDSYEYEALKSDLPTYYKHVADQRGDFDPPRSDFYRDVLRGFTRQGKKSRNPNNNPFAA